MYINQQIYQKKEEKLHIAFGGHNLIMERLINIFDTLFLLFKKIFEEKLKILGDKIMSEKEAFIYSYTIDINQFAEQAPC